MWIYIFDGKGYMKCRGGGWGGVLFFFECSALSFYYMWGSVFVAAQLAQVRSSLRKTIFTGIIEEQPMEDRVDFKVLYLKPVVQI